MVKKCDEIICLIHSLDPAPTAYTIYNGEMLKIWQAEKIEQNIGEVGRSNSSKQKGFVVTASDGSIVITEVQAKRQKKKEWEQMLI